MNDAPCTILIVDDDETIRDSCRQTLERSGHRTLVASDGVEALGTIARKRIDLILLDLRMPGLDGVEFLRRLRKEPGETDVIVITGYSSIPSAVRCMQLGAIDYLPKPFDPQSLRGAVDRALERRRSRGRAVAGPSPGRGIPTDELTGESPAIRRVRQMVRLVGPTDSTVLILGESGTGKELVARAIHQSSGRRERPFVTVDCGAIVEGLYESELFGHVKGAFTGAVTSKEGRFQMADGGTIFLDEIANIGRNIQSKLLRVIQEREITRVGEGSEIRVDVRVIAATNQDLRAAIADGRFREDLFYRLSVVQIEIPPLRARVEDIPLLAGAILERIAGRMNLATPSLSADALHAMQNYGWPGNVREMENKLERAMVLVRGRVIDADDLAFADTDGGPLPDGDADALRLEVLEGRHIRRVLDLTGWRLGRAAALLGIDRKTLWRKVRTYKLR